MFVRFDKKSLSLDILVGVAEEYKPKQELIDLYKQAQELKEKANVFLDTTFGTQKQEEILPMLEKDKELESKWKDFLINVFSVEVQKIQEKIDEINKQG
jgi:hypothetical protein